MRNVTCEQDGADLVADASLSGPPRERKKVESAAANFAREAMATLSIHDIETGWPPKVQGRTDVKPITATHVEAHFNVKVQRQYLAEALRHPEVKELLCGRWEVLGCHRVHHKDHDPRAFRARVCLFNYTENYLVEVYVQDGVVESVSKKPSHAHPEAPIEMAQAIVIAKNDPELKKKTEGLVAHAILQTPDPASPYKAHRCFRVMFTKEAGPHAELPVLFSALVDLNLQYVVTSGECPCSQEVHGK